MAHILRLIFVGLLALHLTVPNVFADPSPRFGENWKTDFKIHSVDLSEILSGGPSKDGIPSIDNPKFIAVADAQIAPSEPVIELEIAGDARAYPLAVLMWHEIANDTIADQPVTVTYCPLCNAAIAFSRKLDGQVLDFGTTGRLRNSDLLMYDRQTESWWQQFSGNAIIGELTGAKLEMLPSTIVPFSQFAQRHPKGSVLVPSNPRSRNYGSNPYVGYDTASRPFLYKGDLPQSISPMQRVIIADLENGPVIISMEKLRTLGEVHFGTLQMEWHAGMASALDHRKISKGRDVGYVTVTRNGMPAIHHVTFAFVAHAFHPEILIDHISQ